MEEKENPRQMTRRDLLKKVRTLKQIVEKEYKFQDVLTKDHAIKQNYMSDWSVQDVLELCADKNIPGELISRALRVLELSFNDIDPERIGGAMVYIFDLVEID